MSSEDILGYIGSATVALLQVPQLLKTYKSKKADELAWGMILLNLFASIIWFSYGVMLEKIPIILANIIYFIATTCLIVMKLKYVGVDENEDKINV